MPPIVPAQHPGTATHRTISGRRGKTSIATWLVPGAGHPVGHLAFELVLAEYLALQGQRNGDLPTPAGVTGVRLDAEHGTLPVAQDRLGRSSLHQPSRTQTKGVGDGADGLAGSVPTAQSGNVGGGTHGPGCPRLPGPPRLRQGGQERAHRLAGQGVGPQQAARAQRGPPGVELQLDWLNARSTLPLGPVRRAKHLALRASKHLAFRTPGPAGRSRGRSRRPGRRFRRWWATSRVMSTPC